MEGGSGPVERGSVKRRGAEAPYTIGQLAKLTGVPVKTIRFYSDSGVLPPAARTAARYRLYDEGARAQLELVRSLREVGLDLETIRGVVARRLAPVDAARVQLEAVEAQLRALKRVRSVLRAALDRGDASAEFLDRLHRLARLTKAERVALINDFLDRISDGTRPEGIEAAAELRRMAVPELPDEPTVEQLDAWLELATIATDPGFQERLRTGMTGFWAEMPDDFDLAGWHQANDALMEQVCAAVDAGVAADSPEAARYADAFYLASARAFGRDDTPAFRASLLERYEAGSDPRAGRYWQLVAIINGWDSPSPAIAATLWLFDALRHAVGGGTSARADAAGTSGPDG
jgi:DNA-binding transcriptional MerR regulator